MIKHKQTNELIYGVGCSLRPLDYMISMRERFRGSGQIANPAEYDSIGAVRAKIAGDEYLFSGANSSGVVSVTVKDETQAVIVDLDMQFLKKIDEASLKRGFYLSQITVTKQNCSDRKLEEIMKSILPDGLIAVKR